MKISSYLRNHPCFRANTNGTYWERITLATGSDIAALMAMLDVDSDMVEVILLNGQISGAEQIMADGDKVEMFPVVCGG